MHQIKKEITRVQVVQMVVDKLKAKRYLEIGVLNGSCFLAIQAARKIAVDPFFQISKRNKKNAWRRDWRNLTNKYFEMTSDDFFYNHKSITRKKFDVVFIDGLHTYEQTLKDAENAIECLNDNGVIIMHDCFPPHEAASFAAPSLEAANEASPPGWTGEWCGDVWKVVLNIRSLRDDVNAFVFDTDKGLGIITKRKTNELLNYTLEDIDKMTYKEMMSDPSGIIGLRDISLLDDFLNTL